MRKLIAAILPILLLVSCKVDPVIGAGRDTAAASQGAIIAAQAQCSATPSAKVCTYLPQAISAQNLLVTSLETACGWSPNLPPVDPNAKCVVVQGALPALTAATQNIQTVLLELKEAM